MNEQDTAAADVILLMEAEEKVKMRILNILMDVLRGYQGNMNSAYYNSAFVEAHSFLKYQIRHTIKEQM